MSIDTSQGPGTCPGKQGTPLTAIRTGGLDRIKPLHLFLDTSTFLCICKRDEPSRKRLIVFRARMPESPWKDSHERFSEKLMFHAEWVDPPNRSSDRRVDSPSKLGRKRRFGIISYQVQPMRSFPLFPHCACICSIFPWPSNASICR